MPAFTSQEKLHQRDRPGWAGAREIYEVEASAKPEREFFAIVDKTFHQASDQRQSGGNPATASESPAPSTDSSGRGKVYTNHFQLQDCPKSGFEEGRGNRKYSGTRVEPPSSYVICSKATNPTLGNAIELPASRPRQKGLPNAGVVSHNWP